MLLNCERCGTSFNEMRGGALESCPRCRVRDGARAPLVRKPAGEVAPQVDLVVTAGRAEMPEIRAGQPRLGP